MPVPYIVVDRRIFPCIIYSLNIMIKDNILKVRERIAAVCAGSGRDPASITIIAVSKGRTVEQIKEAIDAGITNIGENKVQEALEKFNRLSTILRHAQDASSKDTERSRSVDYRLSIHMIGHLQTNKVKDAVKIFDLIHSVDSLRLAREIDRQSVKINKVQDVLIEVNTSGEAAKFGLKPDEAPEVIKEISQLKNINVKGLMTIAPVIDNPEQARPYFKELRQLRDEIYELRVTSYELRILSMGMTDDFEAAVEEGATIVRIGRAIFD